MTLAPRAHASTVCSSFSTPPFAGDCSAALDDGNDFAITWDLRKLVPPSLAALSYGQTWQTENAADIERLGKSITVLVSSPVTRVCANLCTRVCNPPQPLRICSSTAEAIAFAADAHKKGGRAAR